MNSLLEVAISNAVVATVLALVVYSIGRVCKKPALMHCLWVLVILKLVTPPV
ncbi:MAG: hypothetical protein HON53_03375 [Planctomycetaceae bacterium]|nr:hypothetical protein [Planctomycetaceae bacterium]MBT6157708.1 hypothetical protein [Planctomycetaceae bacterium]